MYGGKNTLIRASVDRREACSPDVTLSKNLFFDSFRNGGFIMIYTGIEQLVGHTPLYCPERLLKGKRLYGNVLCKLEMFNPAGSVKDRAGLYMILDAEEKGLLAPGGTIIEPTSGNTGIGLAAAAAARGYKVILTMPDSMSAERRAMLRAYGAELVLTPGAEGMAGAVKKAEALHAAAPGSIIAGQFENPANAKAHYETTGPEIWDDTEGKVDIFVAGIGTGGTITGTGRYLKEKRPSIRVIGVEPAASPLLTEGKAGPHGLQGIGANFVPELLDRKPPRRGHPGGGRRRLPDGEGAGAGGGAPLRHHLRRGPLGGGPAGGQAGERGEDDRRPAAGQRRPVPVGGDLRLNAKIRRRTSPAGF